MNSAIKGIWELFGLVCGLFAILALLGIFVVAALVAVPFMLLRALTPWGGREFDPVSAAEFQGVFDALAGGDIAALEAERIRNPGFPNARDGFINRSWLTNAIDAGNPDSVAWVLDRFEGLNDYDDEGRSPLTAAIEADNLGIVGLLVAKGADVNARGTLDVTPLHVAATLAGEDVVRLLLDNGADPFALDSDYVPSIPVGRATGPGRSDVRNLLKQAMERGPDGHAG